MMKINVSQSFIKNFPSVSGRVFLARDATLPRTDTFLKNLIEFSSAILRKPRASRELLRTLSRVHKSTQEF